MLLTMGNRRIPNKLMTFCIDSCLFRAHTGLHSHMTALDVKRVSSALCHQAEAVLPAWEGLAQRGPLETGRKLSMAAVVSTGMTTVCCCWPVITALMPIARLGKQTESVRELTCGPGGESQDPQQAGELPPREAVVLKIHLPELSRKAVSRLRRS